MGKLLGRLPVEGAQVNRSREALEKLFNRSREGTQRVKQIVADLIEGPTNEAILIAKARSDARPIDASKLRQSLPSACNAVRMRTTRRGRSSTPCGGR